MRFLLTIAGFDPSGGAGVLRDIWTFSKMGWSGKGVITSITFQDGKRVSGRFDLSPEVIEKQLEEVSRIGKMAGIKIGMLGNSSIVRRVAEFIKNLRGVKVVLDPVLFSSDGFPLLDEDAYSILLELLFPLCTIVTPNAKEALKLSGKNDVDSAGEYLLRYAKRLLIKGGDLDGCDRLFTGKKKIMIKGKKLGRTIHGSGCLHSSALLASLCSGNSIFNSVRMAKKMVEKEINKEVIRCMRI